MTETPISRALRLARAKGMNQSEFAAAMGVLPQHVTNWKARGMPPEHYRQAAKVLGVTVESLLDEKPAGVNKPSGLADSAAPVTDLTFLPDPFDHHRFRALSPEQQRNIAEVAAYLVSAFERYNVPPTDGEKGAWKRKRAPAEKQAAAGPRIQSPVANRKRGNR